MPATTVPYGLPYPLPGDPTHVAGTPANPGDVQLLAQAADTQITTALAAAQAAGMPSSVVVQGGPQPVDNNVITDMAFNAVTWDNAGYADLGLTPYLITLENGGLYVVQGTIAFAPNANGWRRAQLIDGNGATFVSREVQAVTDPGTGVTIQLGMVFQPNFFSSIRLQAQHLAGTTIQVLSCTLSAVKIG
jgi:hypothetical protein